MSRFPDATPCPIPVSSTGHFTPRAVEETIIIDFTTDLQAAFRSAAPRRRRKVTNGIGTVRIFEDQGPRMKTGITEENGQRGETLRTGGYRQAGKGLGRRDKLCAAPVRAISKKPASTVDANIEGRTRTKLADLDDKMALRKEPRRRTIYVPSEDTTILTIHPGMKYGSAGEEPARGVRMLPDSVGHLGRSKVRQSLAAPPKRIPMQPILQKLQENAVSSFDVPGIPSGKENIPPGAAAVDKKGGAATGCGGSIRRHRNSLQPSDKVESGIVFTDERVGASKSRPDTMSRQPLPAATSKRSTASTIAQIQYPLLKEDITQPQMYEEKWLSNQETAVTELINRLFAQANPAKPKPNIKSFRHELLQVYQQPPMVTLYKRLQASLHYGALSPPKESTTETMRLANDVSTRRKFIHLWTKTYSLEALWAAIEVVVGRHINLNTKGAPWKATSSDLGNKCDIAPPSPGQETCRVTKPTSVSQTSGLHSIKSFIETCLLQNEDAARSNESLPSPALWSWRRTMQRSLMLINLLDKAKEMGIIHMDLFRKNSSYKSSAAVLKELTAILVPSGGDLSRALAHVDYQLQHIQNALSEYRYAIQNLAVDLRDGVRLTRLVELLLSPSPKVAQQRSRNVKPAIAAPSTKSFDSSASNPNLGFSSSHLKFPCLGRTQKLANVQIALTASQGINGAADMSQRIKPEDIVDGHRENTMILLWGLVGHWGMDCLVDREDLEEETWRLQNDLGTHSIPDEEEFTESAIPSDQKQLLRGWAKAVANKHGLEVLNLTSSFGDGKVFECIVDEYHEYLRPRVWRAVELPMRLEAKLRKIGCSESFASIFGCSTQAEQYFDEDFTVAALAYFSSRLLGISRIRRKLAWLAHDCMMVVTTRNKVVGAAIVIQRAWRAHTVRERHWADGAEAEDIWLV